MKAEILVPTVEYGNIKFQVEGTSQEIIDEARSLINSWKGGFGLEAKQFNGWLDRYLTEGTGNAELYSQMSSVQQSIIQEIKKSMKRINYKNGKKDESN